MTLRGEARDTLRDVLDALGAADRGAAVFLYDQSHASDGPKPNKIILLDRIAPHELHASSAIMQIDWNPIEESRSEKNIPL
jgi:hypothetical protein